MVLWRQLSFALSEFADLRWSNSWPQGEIIMRRTNWLYSLACVATGLMGGCQAVNHHWGMGNGNRTGLPAGQASSQVNQVDLFPNGVGYIGFKAAVDNSQTLNLPVNPNDVNDLLKTIVFFDSSNRAPEVNFATPIPLSVKLAGLPLSPSENGSWISLLSELKGRRISLIFKKGKCVNGRLIGIKAQWPISPLRHPEPQQQSTNAQPAIFAWPPRYADIYHDGRVTRVSLANLVSFKVRNHQLRASLRKAMRYIAANRQTGAASIAIRFRGSGRRIVRFGYATQTPLWRMTYRLLLPPASSSHAPAPAAQMMADALVHNTTSTSWKHITLHINGTWPHSFIEDLRHPLYGRRPVVPAPADTALTPQGGLFYLRNMTAANYSSNSNGFYPAQATAVNSLRAMPQMALAAAKNQSISSLRRTISVQAMAEPQSSNPAFDYVARDISIRSEHSASFPILSSKISARVVSVINVNLVQKHARRSVLLFNNSDRYLPAGPMTVFEGATYSGEINAPSIAVNSRLVMPFATDLSLTADVTNFETRVFQAAKFHKGRLVLVDAVTNHLDIKLHSMHRNRIDVVAALGRPTGWHLASTPYHILHLVSGIGVEIPVAAMSDKTYRIAQLSSHTSYVDLLAATPDQLSALAQTKGMKASVVKGLTQTVTFKKALVSASRTVSDITSQIANLNASEDRIRQNLAAAKSAPKEAQLFAKELIALDRKLSTSQRALRAAKKQELKARHTLDGYIRRLK